MIRPDDIFVLFTSGLCIVMAIGLFIEHPLNLRKKLLAIVLIPMSYIQLSTFLLTSRLIYKVPNILFTQIPFGLIIAPLLYLYVRTFLQDNRHLAARDYIHFLLPLTISLAAVPIMFLSREEKIIQINRIYGDLSLFSSLAILIMIISLFYSTILVLRIARVFHKENPVHKRLLLLFSFILTWIIITLIKIIGFVIDEIYVLRISNLIFSTDIFLLYFSLHRMPFLLNYANLTTEQAKPRSKSLLNGIDTKKLKDEIEIMMDTEKLYCDEDLTLARLAHALEITPHQLSEFLNEDYGKNFNSYINSYRVQYALSLLAKDPEASTLSIAFACGFNSYSAFFSAFKKETGVSPAEFKASSKSG